MKIRNKKTGEIKVISENELNQYGLGGKLNKLGVENSLWNNIRDNAGSGKEPTKEMLEQERKINKKEYGGYTNLPNNMASFRYEDGGEIHIDPAKKGTFKAQATRMGMGVQEAASKILNAPEGTYSPAMRKKANFAKNFAKEDGGLIQYNLPTHEDGGGTIDQNGKVVNPNNPQAVAELEKKETLDPKQDYIFSDTLKPMNTKRTFAEISKSIDNKYKNTQDPISVKSKERELGRLAQANEEIRIAKEAKSNPFKKQYGGFFSNTENVNNPYMNKSSSELQNLMDKAFKNMSPYNTLGGNKAKSDYNLLKDALIYKQDLEQLQNTNTAKTKYGTSQQSPEMKHGGNLPKYNDGTFLPKQTNWWENTLGSGTVDTFGTNQIESMNTMTPSFALTSNTYKATVPENTISLNTIKPTSLTSTQNLGPLYPQTNLSVSGELQPKTTPSFLKEKRIKDVNDQRFTTGDKMQLAGLAPATLYNTIQALRPAEKFKPLTSSYFGAGLNDMNQEVRFNTNPLLMNRNVGINQINQGSTSDAVRRANLQNLYRGTNTQLGELSEKEALANAQIKQSLGQAKIGVGAQDLAAQERARQYEIQAKQAKQQFGATAASQLGQGLTEFGKSSNQGLSNRIGYDVLKNISPNFTLTEYNDLVKKGFSDAEIIKFINK